MPGGFVSHEIECGRRDVAQAPDVVLDDLELDPSFCEAWRIDPQRHRVERVRGLRRPFFRRSGCPSTQRSNSRWHSSRIGTRSGASSSSCSEATKGTVTQSISDSAGIELSCAYNGVLIDRSSDNVPNRMEMRCITLDLEKEEFAALFGAYPDEPLTQALFRARFC